MQKVPTANAWAAGDAAVTRYRDALAFAVVVAASRRENSPATPTAGSSRATVTSPTPEVAVAAAASPWDCIATAETGGDYTMHGSTYSTAFGVINDIVYEYGSAQEQADIFSGTASKEEQIAVVSRFTAEHGFGGWGERTKAVCGL